MSYEVCFSCNGSGLQDGTHGPVTCYVCKGDCTIPLRDSKGRFLARGEGNGERGDVSVFVVVGFALIGLFMVVMFILDVRDGG